jgi:hypothetical protein
MCYDCTIHHFLPSGSLALEYEWNVLWSRQYLSKNCRETHFSSLLRHICQWQLWWFRHGLLGPPEKFTTLSSLQTPEMGRVHKRFASNENGGIFIH